VCPAEHLYKKIVVAMAKSSIHILPVKSGSERHNNREQELNYVRKELSHLNESYRLTSIHERTKFVKENCKNLTGRSMQDKATPIREGVLIIEETTGIDDLMKLASELESQFGIKTIQAYTHKDEGHWDGAEWKPNYHAHMVFDWTDHSTGKSLKLNKQDMAALQTVVAKSLGLERGQSSEVKHLTSIAFKIEAEAKRLEQVYGLDLGALQVEQKKLKDETELHQLNLSYIKSKSEKELAVLQGDKADLLTEYNQLVQQYTELNKQVIQKKNQGFKR
jgi:hypothetical protein